MQLDKYIKTDLEQAKKLQISALNNILACIEKGEKLPVTNISSISMSILNNIYNKQLLTEIHKYNHLRISQTAFANNNDLQYDVILHDRYTVVNERLIKIPGPLKAGIYYFYDH